MVLGMRIFEGFQALGEIDLGEMPARKERECCTKRATANASKPGQIPQLFFAREKACPVRENPLDPCPPCVIEPALAVRKGEETIANAASSRRPRKKIARARLPVSVYASPTPNTRKNGGRCNFRQAMSSRPTCESLASVGSSVCCYSTKNFATASSSHSSPTPGTSGMCSMPPLIS